MKTGLAILAVCCSAIALAWCIPNKPSDLQWLRSTSAIQKSLLKTVPPGSSFAKVNSYFSSHHRIVQSIETSPAIDFGGRNLGGRGYIRAHLGGYWFLLRCDVEAIAIFDDKGLLSDFLVVKENEGL